MRMVLVLPAPLGPSIPKQRPGSTRKVTPSTARSSPKLFTRSTASTTTRCSDDDVLIFDRPPANTLHGEAIPR